MQSRGSLVLGLFFVGLGILFLLQQFFGIPLVSSLWPLLFVAIGCIFFAGMFTAGKSAGGLAIPGAMLVMLGLVFLYQNAFDHFESWAYAWALVAPTGVGIGLVIFGWWSEKRELRRAGVIVAGIGLVLFLGAGAFFELLFTALGMNTPGRFLLPLGLVVAGILLLFGKDLIRAFGSWLIGGDWTWRAGPGVSETAPQPADTPPAIVKQIESKNQGGES
jgi:hypothetical protein